MSVSDLSIILTLALIFTNVGIFACNFKWLAFSNRVTSLVTSLGISLSTLALSYCSELYQYVVLYGMVYGFFIGFGYMAPLKNCYDHLPDRKGSIHLTQDSAVALVSWASDWELYFSTSSLWR